jgi:hypothetical protein
MNGEFYQICCIVAAAKNALKSKSKIRFTPLKYENRIEFRCLAKDGKKRPYKADNVESWFDYCLEKDITDFRFLSPYAVEDRNILGFSNTTQSSIVCFYGETVTYFSANWKFDRSIKMWNTEYSEQKWDNAPSSKPKFKNNSEKFKEVLKHIKKLAIDIECNNFAETFQKALDILTGKSSIDNSNMPLPQIPEEAKNLFQSANIADVFGGMGSWNDEPPYAAHEKGMQKEYEKLSNDLLKEIRLAIMYAINEW